MFTNKKKTDLICLGEREFTVNDVVTVARRYHKVEIPDDLARRLEPSLSWVSQVMERGSPVVYGLNTGVGSKFKERAIGKGFQKELLCSHATGVGEPFSEEVIRATMFLLGNSLAKGHSGVRSVVIETLISMLNKSVVPVVPSKGSIGSSGDLIPLSHISLVLSICDLEEYSGFALYKGKIMKGKAAMKAAGMPQIHLKGREGLALINGPWVSAAMAALAVYDAWNSLHRANLSASMTMEALGAFVSPFYDGIYEVRPQDGQREVSREVVEFLEGSDMVHSVEEVQSSDDLIGKFAKVHDAYSIRCIPQVHGAVWDALSFINRVTDKEINAVLDNPVIFPNALWKNKAVSGGNPHGEQLAMCLDFLAISLAELGNVCERRIYRLINNMLSEGLPSGLTLENEGGGSGLEILHYTAAALVSENKILSHPASIDSIPMAGDMEDYVSMATNAANKARSVVENLKTIISIELISATRAIYLRTLEDKSLKLGKQTALAYKTVKKQTAVLKLNPIWSEEVKKVVELIDSEII